MLSFFSLLEFSVHVEFHSLVEFSQLLALIFLFACFLLVSQSMLRRGCPKEHLHFADRWFVFPPIFKKVMDCSQMTILWDRDLSQALYMVLADKLIRVIVLVPRDQPSCRKLLLHRVDYRRMVQYRNHICRIISFSISDRSRIWYEERLSGTLDGGIVPPELKTVPPCVSVIGFSSNLAIKLTNIFGWRQWLRVFHSLFSLYRFCWTTTKKFSWCVWYTRICSHEFSSSVRV